MNKHIFRTTMAILWLATIHLIIWPHVVPASGQTVGGSFIVKDTIPPAVVTDLSVIASQSGPITLRWTAPGDDYYQGMATHYDIRYSRFRINTKSDWNAATQLSKTPIPQIAGTSESFVIGYLAHNTRYHFSLKTSDEAGNWSDLSNCASVFTAGGIDWVEPLVIDPSDDHVLPTESVEPDESTFVGTPSTSVSPDPTEPAPTLELNNDTPDMHLDLSEKDLVRADVTTEQKPIETVWKWSTIFYLCLIILLAIMILLWPVRKRLLQGFAFKQGK